MLPDSVSPRTFKTRLEVHRDIAADPTHLSEIRPLPAAQERQAMALDSGAQEQMEERRVLVVSAGCPWHEHHVHVATIGYLAQLRRELLFREDPAAVLRRFPQHVPFRDG